MNTSYGSPSCPFLGTMSYTSLLALNQTAAAVTYDLRLPQFRGYASVQMGFSMAIDVAAQAMP